MQSLLFRPTDLEQAKDMSVGAVKGLSMQQRWDEETPVFAKAIVRLLPAASGPSGGVPGPDTKCYAGPYGRILDYGCGPGRIAKAVLEEASPLFENYESAHIVGVDNSAEMLTQADQYVANSRFATMFPEELTKSESFDFCYSVYCFQHIPAIEIRDALQRIWTCLKDNSLFFFCGSENRMAQRFDGGGFFDDRFLGVNISQELSRFFDKVGPAIPEELMNDTVRHMVSGNHAHPAILYRKRKITGPLFNAPIIEASSIKKSESKPIENEPMEEALQVYKLAKELGITSKELIEAANEIGITLEGKNKHMKNLQPSEVTRIKAALSPTAPTVVTPKSDAKKIILRNPLSPGDILVMSAALRALHKAYPGEYVTGVESPCPEIFANSPYVAPVTPDEAEVIHMHYPEIDFSGESGYHFAAGHRMYLAEQIGRPIPQAGLLPDIFLTKVEREYNPVKEKLGYGGQYILIDAGVKGDYTLKKYFYYQEVVDLLAKEDITCVQVGQLEHDHPLLENVLDLRGKTNLREFFSAIYHADVVITPVSLPMHAAAALKQPCVVLALGREAPRWEYYPSHRYLCTHGALPCCSYDGCGLSKLEDCTDLVDDAKYGKVPHCQKLIPPKKVFDAVMMYYQGGMVTGQGKPSIPIPGPGEAKSGKEVGITNDLILKVLLTLKPHNPGDPYLENYKWHIEKRGDSFYDIYHFAWEWVREHKPTSILEIGTWTGNSLGQLLSAYEDYSQIERIVTCDIFDQPNIANPEIVKKNLGLLGIPQDVIDKVEILVGDSKETIPQYIKENPGVTFDYILADGAHHPPELPRADLDNCVSLVVPGGVIILDDIAPDGMSLDTTVWQPFKMDHLNEFEWHENYNGKGIGYGVRK